MRKTPLYYGHQTITKDDILAVEEVLRGDYLTCGPEISMLERDLATYTNAKYAVAVSNGTAALHCACLAAGIGPGDEVITTPLTFAASANCIRYCGATVVFADVDIHTYNISPESIRKHVSDRTKAVIAVDFTGQAIKHKEIRQICDEYGLILIEDAAHAIGTAYDGQMVGSLADMTCFSFHPVKTITSGEGGAITTNCEELYNNLVLAHTHGITHDIDYMSGDRALIYDDESYNTPAPWYYEEISLGYNYRMTDFQAALLRSQLKRIDGFKKRRQQIVNWYNDEFSAIPEIIVQEEIPESDTCRHLYILRLDFSKLNCSRREFFEEMRRENIYCQIHYIPVYLFPYYQSLGYKEGLCPNAERIYRSIMSLPLYPSMTDEDVKDVIDAVKKLVNRYRK